MFFVRLSAFFTGHAIKSNEGEENWNEFFKLVSCAFAISEKCPTIPGITNNKKKLYALIKEKELNAITKMQNWMESIRMFNDIKKKTNNYFFLLELDTIQKKLLITSYSKKQENKAIRDYATAEKNIYGRKEYDVVLVGADTMDNLKKAYPNYFLDTKEFIKRLKKIIS